MTDRRSRGARRSSNCFQTSSAFGFLFFMVFLSGRDIGEKEKKVGHGIEDSGQQPEYGAPIWRDQSKCPARRLHRMHGAVAQALLPVQFAPLRGAVGACFSAPSSRTCGHLVVAQLAASLARKTLELIEECFCLSFRAKRGICFFLCFCRDAWENAKLTAKARGIWSRPPAKRKRAKLCWSRSFTQSHYSKTKTLCKP